MRYLILLIDRRVLGGRIRAMSKVKGQTTLLPHRAKTFPDRASARSWLKGLGPRDRRFRYRIEPE